MRNRTYQYVTDNEGETQQRQWFTDTVDKNASPQSSRERQALSPPQPSHATPEFFGAGNGYGPRTRRFTEQRPFDELDGSRL